MKSKLLGWMAFAFFVAGMTSCEMDGDKTARVQIWVTDAPGDYEQVNVDIQGVDIHANGSDNGKGWRSLNVHQGVYHLLELTNGVDTLLAELEIPAGKVSQIRLILGNNNSIKVNGQVHDLAVPSGQQSGLKLQVHETLLAGVTYKILLDFDVARSVIQTGNASYKLKPVIRAITEAQNGAIKGVVDPKESTPAVLAMVGVDTVGSTFCDSEGRFLLRGIPAGTYKVVFSPNQNYQTVEKANVTVQVGAVTEMGTVQIPEN
jgi:hypothetical protein